MVGLGVVLVLQAGGIFAMLVVLSDSNDRIHAQDAKIGDLRGDIEPVLDLVRPLAAEARPLLRSARGLTRPLARTAEDLSAAAAEAPQVARAVRVAVGESLPVVDAAGRLIPELSAFMGELRAALPSATRFLNEAERRSFLARADAAVSATLHLESLLSRSFALQKTQMRIQKRTLEIQEQALVHIESIDRRTGGQLDAP